MEDSSLLNLPFVSLAYSYLNKEQYGECLQLCNWLDQVIVPDRLSYIVRPWAYSKTGHYVESNEKLDLCIKMSIQEDAHTYLAAKGDNFENMKNYKEAISYYDTAWYIFTVHLTSISPAGSMISIIATRAGPYTITGFFQKKQTITR